MYQKIFALPGNNELYYLLHVRASWPFGNFQCQETELLWSLVDMKQNQGIGKVSKINQVLFNGCIQALSATKHANGRDWWILIASNKEDRFDRYIFRPDGSFYGPWSQVLYNPTNNIYQFGGQAFFSPNASKYIINNPDEGVAIYDFDRCSGLLSNPLFKPQRFSGFGAAISPNERYLYVVADSSEAIDQYDLTSNDVFSTQKTVATWNGKVDWSNTPAKFSFFQNGPDGKIYAWGWDTPYMHIITYPNEQGTKSLVMQQALEFPSRTPIANFYYPNYRLGPLDDSPCDTLGLDNRPVAEFRYDAYDSTKITALQFTDVSWYEPTYWRWDFGDPASGAANKSTEQNPAHEFSKAGGYTVCLIAGNQYASDTICKKVWVGVSNTHALPALPQARVSPNPATDYLRLSLPALLPAHALRFALSDAQGRVLREVQVIDFETDISIANLPRGLYFWHLKVDGEVVQAGKVVK